MLFRSLAGTEVPLAPATLKSLYRSGSDYQARIAARLEELVTAGWFLPEYVETIKADATATTIP